MFDRKIFFDSVRNSLFSGALSQQQVDGMSFKLDQWEKHYAGLDLRWLAYPLATSKHETSSTMWPIEEYGKGQGMSYGAPDPQTGQTYYGRGDVQLTWRDNYARATRELGLTGSDDLEWNAARALDPQISADVMYKGMRQGWFRASSDGKRQTLERYFSASKDDAYTAREIINGDKSKVPSWSGGVSIGKLIQGYHQKFLNALQASWIEEPEPEPEPAPPAPEPDLPTVDIVTTGRVRVTINGVEVVTP
jgi:hypothetical protein